MKKEISADTGGDNKTYHKIKNLAGPKKLKINELSSIKYDFT